MSGAPETPNRRIKPIDRGNRNTMFPIYKGLSDRRDPAPSLTLEPPVPVSMEKSIDSVRYYQDAVAIVTGGASGIGAALTAELVKRGATVIIADLQDDLAGEVARSVSTNAGRAEARHLDVTSAEDVGALVDEVFSTYGRLDFIFNNAGIGIQGEAQEHTPEDWTRTIDINLNGVIYGIAAAYPRMIDQGFGHIVNTASAAGLIPLPLSAAYTATKHGVVGLSRALRIEGEVYGVRTSVVCPGFIRTPILTGGKYGRVIADIDPKLREEAAKDIPALEPEELARRVLDRLSRNHAIIIEPFSISVICFLDRCTRSFGNWFAGRLANRARARIKADVETTRKGR